MPDPLLTAVGLPDGQGLLEPRLAERILKLLLNGGCEQLPSLIHRFFRLDLATTAGTGQQIVRLRIGWTL